ncbi:hypothetical protein KBX14_08695 [Corynebacterium sp. CCUG 61414]|uniref:hypothetical protein n=1 Tax=Corynebacterium sp. CCUG 61414 TaxID=2823896 RepID=UPI00210877AB|nr:hypothetical protein [Corynebacterium sp. CCUG 61414]MCQ4610489.1 hypothetical protein [Corynebacterium sp. CCUG 61414]
MKISKTAGYYGRLAMASALAGTFTLVPVAANADTTTETPTQAPVTTTATAPSSIASSSVTPSASATPTVSVSPSVAGAPAVATTPAKAKKASTSDKPGTGTSGVELESGAWTYTAVAGHPTDGSVYALSTAPQENHLLKIDPATGNVEDLGAARVEHGALPTDITTATITSHGRLIVSEELAKDGDSYYAIDLDKLSTASTPVFTEHKVSVDTFSKPKDFKAPGAWGTASKKVDPKGEYLHAYAETLDGKPALWTLNTDTDKLSVTTLKVARGVKTEGIDRLGEVAYAVTKDTDVFVAGDKDGNTVEFKPTQLKIGPGDELVATFSQDGDDTLSEVLGTDKKFGFTAIKHAGEESDTKTPSAESDKPAENTDEKTAASDSPASESTVTETPKPTEPTTPETSTPATTTTQTTTTKKEEATEQRTLEVEIYAGTGEKKKPVEGARLVVPSLDNLELEGATDADGYLSTTLPAELNDKSFTVRLVEAPEGYKNKSIQIKKDDLVKEITLNKDTRATSTMSKPQEILEVFKEVKPLLGAFGALAGAGAGAAGSKSTSSKTSTTSTFSNSKSSGTVSTGRTTSATSRSTAASRSTAKSTSRSSSKSSSTTTSTRSGDLADTGTPMSGVITLGIVLFLIGGAYVFMGRRRDA